MKIYQSSQDRFVANFIGLTNFIDGRVKPSPCETASIREVETACGDLSCVLDEGMKPGESRDRRRPTGRYPRYHRL